MTSSLTGNYGGWKAVGGGVKAKSRKRKVEIKKQKLKFGKLKAEIAGFELAVFLHFSFQLSTFSFSSVAGGADPGRGAERFSERRFGGGETAANQLFRSHCLEGCGLSANCGNRGQRPQLQWRLGRLVGGFVSVF